MLLDNMNQHCGDNVLWFQEHVFSVSDETFLLTVLYNYSANWMSEIVIRNAKVSTFVCVSCYIVWTYHRILRLLFEGTSQH
jgi:hypothetical protein